MIEAIANNVLSKLLLTPSKDFENFVGIEGHIAEMSALLHLESEEVRMVGVWGSSGIGKTTIARVLFNRLSRHFQGNVYIDRHFIYNIIGNNIMGNPDDYNVKLHLQERFLSKILDKQGVEVNHLGAVRDKLKDMKVVIFIDDLDDQMVLDTLVGGKEWFGRGSRIVAITKDKQILRGHGIKCIYKVDIPSKEVALQMFCRSAFRKNTPPDGFMKIASEIAALVGGLPLGLNLVGASMRGRDKNYWVNMLPTLRKGLDGKIEQALRVSYDGLERNEYKALFRHIACFFNGYEINNFKLLLADSGLNVDIGLEILVDKSLIQLRPSLDRNIIEMHCLVEEMGKEIVRAQSNKPGEREFLTDPKDVCDVLEDSIGTEEVLGISLNIDNSFELRTHKEAFKGMRNLRFLNITAWMDEEKEDEEEKVKWHIPEEGFDYFPPKLKLLRLDGYPMRFMPSKLRPENLVNLIMFKSKLEKLWDGVHSLAGLKKMDLSGSRNLKEIPNLSLAINLEKLFLDECSNLVELPSSIQHLNKLESLIMKDCENLETLPTGINLRSLYELDLGGCSRLKSFPDISTNISELDLADSGIEEFPSSSELLRLVYLDMCASTTTSQKMWNSVQPLTPLMTIRSPFLKILKLSDIPSLVELPSSLLKKFRFLEELYITNCTNLETLPTGVKLRSLLQLHLDGCSRLKTFPYISTNISELSLTGTGIEEVPWWTHDFSKLRYLDMRDCSKLIYVFLDISKLKFLERVDFGNCGSLTEVSWNVRPRKVAMETYNNHGNKLLAPKEASSSLPDDFFSRVSLECINCFSLDQDALLQQEMVFKLLILPGTEVPSYFTHRNTGTFSSSWGTPLFQIPFSQQFFRFRACIVIGCGYALYIIHVLFRFRDRFGNYIFRSCSSKEITNYVEDYSQLVIFDHFPPPHKDKARLPNNYDHMDVRFYLSSRYGTPTVSGCGIRFLEDNQSQDNRPCSSKIPPYVYERDTSEMLNLMNHETEHNEEHEDRAVGRTIHKKRTRATMLGKLLKKLLTCNSRKPKDT